MTRTHWSHDEQKMFAFTPKGRRASASLLGLARARLRLASVGAIAASAPEPSFKGRRGAKAEPGAETKA